METGNENGIGYRHLGLWNPSPVHQVDGTHLKPSLLSATWKREAVALFKEKRTRKLIFIFTLNAVSYCVLLMWCSNTQSLALLAYTYTIGFNILRYVFVINLFYCGGRTVPSFLGRVAQILSLFAGVRDYVTLREFRSAFVLHKVPTPVFTFGYERFEVLAVFGSTVLAQLASLFIVKESLERLVVEQPEIRIGRLLFGKTIAFASHLLVLYGCSHTALDHVAAASASSWLQEHVSDISQSLCSVVPVLSGLLLPRVNPMLLVACTGSLSLLITDILIEFRGCHVVDTLAGVWIALTMWATMLPMSVYSGKVLMQTTPAHLVGQLDKCLRETLTIDGVLEFRNEHFWTLSFGRMAGSLQVRVRRDANEQMVLAHVVDRLSSVVSELTVQVFKDEWALWRGVGNIGTTVGIPPSSFTNTQSNSSCTINTQTPMKLSYGSLSANVSPAGSVGDINPSLLSANSQSSINLETLKTNCVSYTQAIHKSFESCSSLSNNLSASSHALHTTAFKETPFQPPKFSSMSDISYSPGERIDSTSNRKKQYSHSTMEELNLVESYNLISRIGLPGKSPKHQLREENLLITGATTFDTENLCYRPR